MGRMRYTLPRDKLLKKDYEDYKERKLKDGKAEESRKTANILTKYILELNVIISKSSGEK